MQNTSIEKKERFHFLDGFRGIAAILVVLHHSVSAGIAKFFVHLKLNYIGYSVEYFTQSGVTLFFVLSGIVLLRPYFRTKRKFKTGEYFLRRFKRIYPPFFAALVFGYLVVLLIKSGPQNYYSFLWRWSDLSLPEFLRQAMIINLTGNYFNLAWWSLQTEVVFYVLMPLFVFFFSFKQKINYVNIFFTLTITTLSCFALQVFLARYYPNLYSNDKIVLNVYRFIDYPVCFMLGIYLAKFDFEEYIGKIFCVVGVVVIIASGTYMPMVNVGYGFLYTGILIFAFKSKKMQHVLDRPIMIWLGERSYSLFLVHFSVFYLVDYLCSFFIAERNVYYALATRTIGISASFFFAILLFHFVERKQARGLVTANIFWPWQIGRLNKSTIEE